MRQWCMYIPFIYNNYSSDYKTHIKNSFPCENFSVECLWVPSSSVWMNAKNISQSKWHQCKTFSVEGHGHFTGVINCSKLEVPKERWKCVRLWVRFVPDSLVYGLLSGFPIRTSDRAAHLTRCNSNHVHFVSLFLSALQEPNKSVVMSKGHGHRSGSCHVHLWHVCYSVQIMQTSWPMCSRHSFRKHFVLVRIRSLSRKQYVRHAHIDIRVSLELPIDLPAFFSKVGGNWKTQMKPQADRYSRNMKLQI